MRRVDKPDDPHAAVALVVLRSFLELQAREAGALVRVEGRGADSRLQVTLDAWAVHLHVEEGQLLARLRSAEWAVEDFDLLFRSVLPADVERIGTWARRQAANVNQALASTRTGGTPELPRLRLLVIDDESIVRQALGRMLSDHDVDAVSCVDEARPLLAAGAYDGVLLDMVLPGISGLQFLEELRRDAPDVARRVCLMTAQPEVLDAEPAPSLVKPFSRGELLDVLEWFQLSRRGGPER